MSRAHAAGIRRTGKRHHGPARSIGQSLPSDIIETVERLLSDGEPNGNLVAARLRLAHLGYNVYGPDLKTQVTAFQKDAGLQVNGKMDHGTWAALTSGATA